LKLIVFRLLLIFHCFGQEKLGRRLYLDYLKLLAKSGDNLVS